MKKNYYNDYKNIHDKVKNACICIENNSCYKLKDEIISIRDKIINISINDWDDSISETFEINRLECINNLNLIISSIETIFSTAEELYESLLNELNNLEVNNNKLQSMNEPLKSNYYYRKSDLNGDQYLHFDSSKYNSDLDNWNKLIETCESCIINIDDYILKLETINNKDITDIDDLNVIGLTSTLDSFSFELNESNYSYESLLTNISNWCQTFKNNNSLVYTTLSKKISSDAIDNFIEQYSVGATPREKAVIAALSVIKLELDENIVSKYKLSTKVINSVSRPYTTQNLVDNGADCASYISWALDRSKSSTFNNSSKKTIISKGTKTSYDSLQAGDILYNSSHVAMVIDNKISSDGYMIIADASSHETGGYHEGIRLQRINSTSLKKFTGYDMTNFYNQE